MNADDAIIAADDRTVAFPAPTEPVLFSDRDMHLVLTADDVLIV